MMSHQRSTLLGHVADSTEVTGGGNGGLRDEAETSKVYEGTGSVAGDSDGDVKDLWARVRQLEALVRMLQEAARDDIEALKEENDALRHDVALLKKVVASEHKAVPSRSAGFKLPEPKAFDGARDAKVLENFLWDMEEYFRVSGVPDGDKVAMTSMYLSGDAKLWWRSRVTLDASAGRERIESWDRLKKELKLQFLPGNASWVAREALRRLSHTGTLRDYVKAFSSLMLDIQNMGDEDKLFNFMSGLQPWAQTELRRRNVKDLSSAIAIADGLVDFSGAGSQGKVGNKEMGESSGGKSVSAGRPRRVETTIGSTTSEPRAKVSCWTCGGDHLRRNCPKKQSLNAVNVEESGGTPPEVGYCSPLYSV